MVVREGYKLTEVGEIPRDWNLVTLGALGKWFGGGTPSKSRESYWGGKIPWLSPKDFKDVLIYNSQDFITKAAVKQSSSQLAAVDSIVIVTRSGVLRHTFPVAQIKGQSMAINQDIKVLEPSLDYEIDYIKFQLIGNEYTLLGTCVKTGTTVESVDMSSFRAFQIPLPPTQAEQRAIATALGDADAWIRGLEALLAKKRRVKEGVMGELLRPGVGWRTVLLGEVANIKTGSKNNQDKQSNGLYPFYVRSQSVKRINQYSYDEEAILVPGEGNIGSIFHYINGKFEVHQRVYKVSHFSDEISGKYVFYQMKHRFGAVALENSVKATVDSLRLPTFQEFPLPLPPTLKVQLDIVVALDNIHSELNTIQTKLTKARALKSAMMQELLTGKIRLV